MCDYDKNHFVKKGYGYAIVNWRGQFWSCGKDEFRDDIIDLHSTKKDAKDWLEQSEEAKLQGGKIMRVDFWLTDPKIGNAY